MDECIFREENERGRIVLPVSVVENHPPSMRLRQFPPCAHLSFRSPLLLSTVLAYPEQVTNDGHGIASRKLHPYHHPFPPRECASPRLLDYTSPKPSARKYRSALLENDPDELGRRILTAVWRSTIIDSPLSG